MHQMMRTHRSAFDEMRRVQLIAAEIELKRLKTLRPIEEWCEEDGTVLCWRVPVDEPPQVADPRDSDWEEGYYTHWSPLPTFSDRMYRTGEA